MCMCCGEERFDVLHHINKNVKDNNIKNLMLVCIPCHSRYHANKESGKKKARQARHTSTNPLQ